MEDLYYTLVNEIAQWVEGYMAYVTGLDVTLARYNPLNLRGSSYIPLPDKVRLTKAVVNLKNKDEKCFMWSVTRALNLVDVHPERITPLLRKQAEELDWSSIKFPLEPNKVSIDKFEEVNDVSVCIFGFNDDTYVPVRVPKRVCSRSVDLFYFGDKTRKMHYAVVNSLSRLLSSSLSKHKSSAFICRRCLCNQHSHKRLEEHTWFCSRHEPTKTVMPEEGSVQKFRAHFKTIRQPVVVYYDFETLHRKTDEVHGQTLLKDKHIPASFAMVIISDIPGYQPRPVSYLGKDAQIVFLGVLERLRDDFHKKFCVPRKMVFGQEERELHNSQGTCYGCWEGFDDDHPKGHKVRDHCHFTGKYRGALHNICNLRLRQNWTIPVIAHNSSGYDSHLFVRDLCRESEGEETDVGAIPENEQKYISFFKDKYFGVEREDGKVLKRKVTLNFVDSFKHLGCGLDSLVAGLREGGNVSMVQYFGGEKAKLLDRKGVYCYEYLDSFDRFDETSLPPKEVFSRCLGQGSVFREGHKKGEIVPEGISDEDYAHAQKVWEELKCEDFGDFSETYNMADTLQLADVFEAYRGETMETFGIDPVYYPILASVAQDAMLKYTCSEVELLTDENMYMFFEEGCRGGVSMACKRYSKANNKYMGERYNPEEEEVHDLYHDANGLYAGCLMGPLPYKDFKWISKERLAEMGRDHSLIKSCTLELDLDVPEDHTFHDYTSCFPLAPEHKVVGGVTKLVPNLLNKRCYIVHHSALQTYLKHGLILKKIHRGVSYTEKDFIRPYIELCVKKRQASKTKFESDLWKLYNNAVFGKQMENVRACSGVVIVSGELARGKKRLRKLVASPTFRGAVIFSNSSLTSVTRSNPFRLGKLFWTRARVLCMSTGTEWLSPCGVIGLECVGWARMVF